MRAISPRATQRALFLSATLGGLLWGGNARATEDAAAEAAVQLSTVQVQTTRAAAAAPPRSTQWIDPEELALSRDPYQALAIAMPGLSVVESGFDTPSFHLRGVGNYDINPGGRSSIGLQLDGVPLVDTRLARLGFMDLERVEVRPGPRSAEGASGQSAGTINFVSRSLLAERPPSLQASIDSDRTLAAGGAHAGRWQIGEEGAYRIAAEGESAAHGWQQDLQDSGLRLTGPESLQARLAAQTRLAETEFRFRLDWMQRGGAPQSPQFFAFRNDPSLPGARPSAAVQEHPRVPDGAARRATWNPDRVPRLDERLGFVHLEGLRPIGEDLLLALSASGELAQSDNLFNSDGLYVSDLDYTLDRHHRALTLAATLSGLGGELLTGWSLRGGGTKQRVEDQRLAFTEDSSAGYGGFFFRSARLDAKETSDAWFLRGQLDWQLAPRVTATSTLSLQTLDREFSGCTRDSDGTTAPLFQVLSLYTRINGVESLSAINGPLAQSIGAALPSNPTPPSAVAATAAAQALVTELGLFALSGTLLGGPRPGDCITLDAQSGMSQLVNASLQEDLVSARQEVLFEPSPFDKAWVVLATGTAPGSFPSLLSAISSQYRPARRERATTLELGYSRSYVNGQIQASLFATRYRDKQLFTLYKDPVFGTLQRLDNVPSVQLQGAELRLDWFPGPRSELQLEILALRSRIGAFEGLTVLGEARSFKGLRVYYAPSLETTLSYRHYWKLPSRWRLGALGQAVYSSRAAGDLANTAALDRPAYSVFNLGLSLRSGPLQLSLSAENLLDRTYYTALQPQIDVLVRYAGSPRRLRLGFSYEY